MANRTNRTRKLREIILTAWAEWAWMDEPNHPASWYYLFLSQCPTPVGISIKTELNYQPWLNTDQS